MRFVVRRVGARPDGICADPRDHEDRRGGLPLPQQFPLFGVRRDACRHHRDGSDQRRRGEMAEGRAGPAFQGARKVRDLQPRSRRPQLGWRGLRGHRRLRCARELQGGDDRREAADGDPERHLRRPDDPGARRHGRRALLRGAQPFGQLDRDALPPGSASCTPSISSRSWRSPSAISPMPTCRTGSTR